MEREAVVVVGGYAILDAALCMCGADDDGRRVVAVLVVVEEEGKQRGRVPLLLWERKRRIVGLSVWMGWVMVVCVSVSVNVKCMMKSMMESGLLSMEYLGCFCASCCV